MAIVTIGLIKQYASELGINCDVIPIKTLVIGTKAELKEHGRNKTKILNIIDKNDVKSALLIALAHLQESITYYDLLEEMEKKITRSSKKHIFR